MKLTNKQKSIIQKSLKLNEDFFDDLDNNDLNDDPVDDLIDDPDYTYNIHFIICMYPFIKDNDRNGEYAYYFEDPKYKSIIESGFISMKKALDYILNASSIVTDYSEPKFCSSYEKIIETFPFMDNNQSNEFEIKFSDNHFITLKTSINISGRKNTHNIIKLLCSFWRLKQIYDKLVTTIKPNIKRTSIIGYVGIRVYKNNPYKHSKGASLMPWGVKLDKFALDIINFLNSKDETGE